ncbi:variable large family protein [Borreliella burgdorferi 297]|uniref:variable large family protein n=1 Tax=Borreliella burgdorferi TaxID=139 RepID=UPI0021AC88BA|nr:variable large family protein [Borreliella burgdorferi]MCR8909866.1 variable large family protein [Borreliella burgdorferi 297]MCR8909867.1 variable large family protein [Borreliella burgdorferi 297]
MKKISSAIFLGAIFVFVNCKSNVGEDSGKDDPTNKFYQSIIQLGNGFLDVFTSFGGLVADALGFKADPKKSEVKDYFDSLAKKLEETKKGLNDLNNNNNAGGSAGDAEKAAEEGTAGKADGVQGAIAEISKWLEEMAKAAKDAATAASGGNTEIGKVVKVTGAAAAKGGEEKSVNGIASGIKGIVEAAEKAGKEGKLESEAVAAAGGEANEDAGKLFAKKANGGGDAAAAEKAAAAVSAVSGKQILKAIVDAAGKGEKKGVKDVKEAKNPIEAAIGSTGDNDAAAFSQDEMKKNDQIAAAIVLRGMAKDGEFALKNNEHDKAEKGLKSTVESAVNKTVVALTDLVRKAVQAGLKTVGSAVKADSSKTPVVGTKAP